MRYVLISGGQVANTVEWDGDTSKWSPPEGMQAVRYDGPAEVGWAWSNGSAVVPKVSLPLAIQKRDKVLAVAGELTARNAGGFSYQGKVYQLDDASQARITGLAVKADRFAAGSPGATWGGTFIAADNSATTFTAVEFGAFADAASNVVIARRLYARSLKNQIVAAADQASLDAIDITSGWV